MKAKPAVVLLFGENDNDRELVKQLILELRPDAPRLEKRASPLVLMRGREAAKAKKNAQDIRAQVRRDAVRFDVRGVVAHEDCDAVEPAHAWLSAEIDRRLRDVGVPAIPATPAWETETWLFLWPDAAPTHVKGWTRPARTGQRLGLVENAKEAYRRAVRPAQGRPARGYVESDAPKIVQCARKLGIIDRRDAISDSYEEFRERVLKTRW